MGGRIHLASLLLGGLLGWAQAEPRPVQFQVSPPQVKLTLEGQAIPSRGPGLFLLERGHLPSRGSQTKVAFHFSASGWGEQIHWISWDDLSGPLPPVVLPPASPVAYLQRYPWPILAGTLAGFLLLMGLIRAQPKRLPPLEEEFDRRASADLEDPLLGESLHGYVLTRRLGGGGMANVYLGESVQGPKAFKFIKPEARDPEFEARFEREIQVSCGLSHPHIVKVDQGGRWHNCPYLMMDYIEGVTLDRWMDRQGLPLEKVKLWLPQLQSALEYAHGLGIVHRDLKPSNLMVDSHSHLYLMDFGLARSQEASTLTATGMAIGTPAYVAPELLGDTVSKATLTPQTDQYSLGVMIYEWLSGVLPLDSGDVQRLAVLHLSCEPIPLRYHRPDLSSQLEQVLARMLAKDPGQRFPSIREACQQVLQQLP